MARSKQSNAGRLCKLTPEVEKKILEALAKGNTRKDAALANGVGVTTLFTWLAAGRKLRRENKPGRFREFLNAVEKAEAEAVAEYVGIIKDASKESWQAAAWWLERRRHKDYAKCERKEITGKNGGPIQLGADRGLLEEILPELKKAADWMPGGSTDQTTPPTGSQPETPAG